MNMEKVNHNLDVDAEIKRNVKRIRENKKLSHKNRKKKHDSGTPRSGVVVSVVARCAPPIGGRFWWRVGTVQFVARRMQV